MWWRRSPAASAAISSRAGNLVQGSEGGATLLTSIVSLDPIYIYFDVDEATYQRNSRLWFEGKRPSSRDTRQSGAGDADRRDQAVA